MTSVFAVSQTSINDSMESSDKSVSVENITADLGSERIFTKILRVGVLIYDQFGLFLDDNEYNNI